MELLARFIGKDGSMGYRNGTVYTIFISGNHVLRPHRCPYNTIEAFFKNWEILTECPNC